MSSDLEYHFVVYATHTSDGIVWNIDHDAFMLFDGTVFDASAEDDGNVDGYGWRCVDVDDPADLERHVSALRELEHFLGQKVTA